MLARVKLCLNLDIQTTSRKLRSRWGVLVNIMGVVGCVDMITLIEQVREKKIEFLAKRELYWQHQLRVYVENGHNAHCKKKEF